MRRVVPHLALATVVGGIALAGGFDALEHRFADLRFRLLTRPASGRVVIVAMDAHARERPAPDGLPPGDEATVLQDLLEAGAERVALDGDLSPAETEDDRTLETVLLSHTGRVVLPVIPRDRSISSPGSRLWLEPRPEYEKKAALGTSNLLADPDGVLRRYRFTEPSGPRGMSSLAATLAGKAPPRAAESLDFGIDLESIPRLSFEQILTRKYEPADVAGRLVVMGASGLPGETVTVPVAGAVPTTVVHALAAESLIQGRVLRTVPRLLTVLLTIAIGVLFGVLIGILPPWVGLLAAAPALAALAALPLAAQRYGGLMLDVTPWCVTVMGCYVVGMNRFVRQQTAAVSSSTQRLRQSERMTRRVLDKSLDAIAMVDRHGEILGINPAAEMLFSVSRREVVGQNVGRLLDNAVGVFSGEEGGDEDEAGRLVRTVGRRRDGRRFPVELALVPIEDGDRTVRVAFIRDITARQAQEDLLRHQATHDALTGLPNRVLLQERVAEALKTARAERQAVAFMILDLDRFKEINDTLGHQAGDTLLQTIARRLEEPLRETDTIARLGGDEFAVLLPLSGASAAHLVATRLVESLEQPFDLSGLSLHVEASIGVAIFPEHGDDPASLVQRADVAMYAAKKGGTRIRFYEPSDDFSSVQQLSLKSELRKALENNEFELHYQPKVAAAGGLLGVEALLRWNHPKRGRIPPGDFIGIAEHTGLIRGITGWALKEAIRQAAVWERAGLTLPVAVNLSARNLLQGDLPATVEALLAKYSLPPDRAVLEITESMIVEDPKLASEVVGRLRCLGVRISIDDFGTGYSSLSYLRNFPASELKIDKSFVTGVEENPGDRAIVRSTIELAHNLGLRCIAEGVESETAWQLLQTLGCDGAQGYFFAQPLPSGQLEAWVAESRWARMSLGTPPEVWRTPEGEQDELWAQVAEVREILARR